MRHLKPADYQAAIDVQCACNLSGVVLSFARIMERLNKDAAGGTDERNTHPICRLFAEQIYWLATAGQAGYSDYHAASEECERMAKATWTVAETSVAD